MVWLYDTSVAPRLGASMKFSRLRSTDLLGPRLHSGGGLMIERRVELPFHVGVLPCCRGDPRQFDGATRSKLGSGPVAWTAARPESPLPTRNAMIDPGALG